MEMTQYPSLRNRTVVVTGGASGIGEAIVRAFAANGARIAILDIQEEAGSRLVSDLSSGQTKVDFYRCDLTDIEAMKAAFARIRREIGPVAVLVNNAANDRRQDFLDVSAEEFDWMMSVNLRHVFFAAQAVVPNMRELGYGSIINMTSGAWIRGALDMQAYCTAKAAIVGFTNSLARQVGPDRIRVNAVAPGMIITDRQRALWYQDENKIAAGRQMQCIPDPVEESDVARVCLFLAADDSKMITKQVLLVNGGTV
ncbi:SDR family NAD(P)-dependent oxidoreductase [Rhizobium mayense]|uniref:SDR family NAD(P)-dependent oxidoreductase n=1 Tax=Rhizobium mayense TaxID=1312184 RepID=A0ABT7JN65_9HYPH|nr:SDR family NAD(P)-dependent oxidoreductase [Rhizobium mayense]MDL2397785.1 SDR family NAD(P)-dependent oxidoreductase [Rhizobium mayense]